jgi:hypothetical protein
MSVSAHTHERPNLVRRVVGWWQNLGWRPPAASELRCCTPGEVERLAHDAGVSSGDLCILAGRWPDPLDLLSQRMVELKLDTAEVARVEPQVIRDLQRTCALCASKRRCRHDLTDNPSDPAWQDYCPNAMTLSALLAERGRPAATKWP